MSSRVFRRRSATAAWVYAAVAFGIVGMIIAARRLGLEEFGVFATALAAVGFFQVLLDLTVEESLTKYGFRYVAASDWGRLRRLFRRMLVFKLIGGALATAILLVASLRSPTRSSARTASGPLCSPPRSCRSCRRRRTWARRRCSSTAATTCAVRTRQDPGRCA